jgi:osmoprotectant transport system permease protein
MLALVVDQLLALMEGGLRGRNRARLAFGGAGLALVVVASLVPTLARPPATYVFGSKPFAESYILAALMEQRLRDGGHSASRREGLGSSIVFNALAAGEIDVYVDYSGTVWTNFMKRSDIKPRKEMLEEIAQWCERQHGIRMLGSLGFENAYALAMRRDRAEALGIRTVEDLARQSQALSIAADVEFFVRPEWRALQQDYGLKFMNERQLQATFMYRAVADGEIDVIAAYSSDGQIAQYDLVLLEDPKRSLPPYDAVILLAPGRAADRALTDALAPLLGAVTVERMRQANLMTSGGDGTAQTSPAEAARWLSNAIATQK